VVEWQRDVSDPNEFFGLKVDLYPEEVYTFTPKGKVVVLPRDATPIDFAYTIHTEVGHTCVGAKVNGRMVPLRHKLHSGDIVEILTQPATSPAATGWAGQVLALAQQDQALAQRSPARALDRNWPQGDRERSAQVSHRAERNQRRRVAESRLRLRTGQGRRPDVRHRLRKIFRAAGAGAPAAGGRHAFDGRRH
jgi:(p)ppGpp synthase/HD superfamily hydrolase